MNNVMIIGHRGASFYAPQNTKAAFVLAEKMHADGVETDVHLTIDNELVIHHNYFIDATSDGAGAIELMTLEELKKRDFGSYFSDMHKGERILTLEEFLEVTQNFEMVNIELKSPVRKDFDYAGKVVKTVLEANAKERVIFSSFDAGLLMDIKRIDESFRIGLLTMYEKADMQIKEMTALFLTTNENKDYKEILLSAGVSKDLVKYVDSLEYKPDFLHPDYRSILDRPEIMDEMKTRGIGVNPYTVDDPETIKKLIDYGCLGIITNKPDIAREVYHGTYEC